MVKLTKRDCVATVGLVVLLGLFILTVFGPCIPAASRFSLLVLQALAGAAAAGALLGRLAIRGTALGFAIEAGGTVAVAILIFVAGLNAQLASGHAVKIGSPTLKRIVGNVVFESGDLLIEGLSDGADIHSPTILDVDGGVTIKFGTTTIKQAPGRPRSPDGCQE